MTAAFPQSIPQVHDTSTCRNRSIPRDQGAFEYSRAGRNDTIAPLGNVEQEIGLNNNVDIEVVDHETSAAGERSNPII